MVTGMMAAGLGRGAMKGHEAYRRHRREDAQDERADESHGLAMRLGDQRYESTAADMEHNQAVRPIQREAAELGLERTRSDMAHQDSMRPIQREAAELGLERTRSDMAHQDTMRPLERRTAEHQLEAAERGAEEQVRAAESAQEIAEANIALRALGMGDLDAVNGWYNSVMPNDAEMRPVQDGRVHIAYSDGDEEVVPVQEIQQRILAYIDPQSAAQGRGGPDHSVSDIRGMYSSQYSEPVQPNEAVVMQAYQEGGMEGLNQLYNDYVQDLEAYRSRPSFDEFASQHGLAVNPGQQRAPGGSPRFPLGGGRQEPGGQPQQGGQEMGLGGGRQAPIDPQRPAVENPDGSVSTERTITVGVETEDGPRFLLVPTIVNGEQLDPDRATQMVLEGQLAPVGIFGSQDEADAAAEQRSDRIGEQRSAPSGGQRQAPPAAETPDTGLRGQEPGLQFPAAEEHGYAPRYDEERLGNFGPNERWRSQAHYHMNPGSAAGPQLNPKVTRAEPFFQAIDQGREPTHDEILGVLDAYHDNLLPREHFETWLPYARQLLEQQKGRR